MMAGIWWGRDLRRTSMTRRCSQDPTRGVACQARGAPVPIGSGASAWSLRDPQVVQRHSAYPSVSSILKSLTSRRHSSQRPLVVSCWFPYSGVWMPPFHPRLLQAPQPQSLLHLPPTVHPSTVHPKIPCSSLINCGSNTAVPRHLQTSLHVILTGQPAHGLQFPLQL